MVTNMARVRSKICGITRPADARIAVAHGVDAIGIILAADSPRLINSITAVEIRAEVPAFISLVGVFVDADIATVKDLQSAIDLDLVQLHGAESAAYAAELQLPYIKAIRAQNAAQVAEEIAQYQSARAILLDPYVAGQHGGTGQQLDTALWPVAGDDTPPLILAGGLSADNLVNAINATYPYAVDLNSGLETHPGIKSATKIAAAMQNLNRYNAARDVG